MGIVREYTFRGDDLWVWRAVRQWANAHGFTVESLEPSALRETLAVGMQLLRLTRTGHYARMSVTVDRTGQDTCQIRLSLEDDGGGDRWVVVELAAALHDLGAELDAPEPRETPAGDVTGSPGVGLPPVTDEIDQFILNLVTADPDLTDDQVAARLPYRNKNGLPFSRQAINPRRRKLKAMGYTVR